MRRVFFQFDLNPKGINKHQDNKKQTTKKNEEEAEVTIRRRNIFLSLHPERFHDFYSSHPLSPPYGIPINQTILCCFFVVFYYHYYYYYYYLLLLLLLLLRALPIP